MSHVLYQLKRSGEDEWGKVKIPCDCLKIHSNGGKSLVQNRILYEIGEMFSYNNHKIKMSSHWNKFFRRKSFNEFEQEIKSTLYNHRVIAK